MLKDIAEAMLGRRPFDLIIRNVQIVNVFSASIVSGSIGIVNGHIAGVFGPEEALDSRRSIDGGNAYALPGFVDSHMHLESSMLTPEHFAQVALSPMKLPMSLALRASGAWQMPAGPCPCGCC